MCASWTPSAVGLHSQGRERRKTRFRRGILDPEHRETAVHQVKGRIAGARTVTITSGEIRTALNKPDDFILAIVEIDGEIATPRYIRRPFQREPDFGVTSVNYAIGELLRQATEPR